MKCLYINGKEYKFQDNTDFESFVKNLPPNFVKELREAFSVNPTDIDDGLANSFDSLYKNNYKGNIGKIIAIIGTAGRSKSSTIEEWNNMLKDAESRVSKNDTLISGGAAFADHIAVKLFLEGKVKELKLRLPAKIVNNKFVGGYGTAGGTANYYHDSFSKIIGVNTIAEIQQAIDKGAEVTYETETSNKAMFIRNEKVAKESNSMIAYTYGEGNTPDDGGTKDTWDKSKYGDKTHVSINKISNQPQQTLNQSEKIYNQLGNKTQSENIVLPNDLGITYTSTPNNFWNKIEPAFRKKYPKGLVAFRGNQSNFNIGNPFDWQKHGVGEATEMFIDWITTGNNYNEVAATEILRKDYIEKIKRSKGEKILYYAETGRPTHSTALDYLINSPNSPFNQVQQIESQNLESLEPTVSSKVINSSTINTNVQEAFDRFVSKLNTQPNPLEYKIGDTYEIYSSTGSLDGVNTIVGENGAKWLIKTRAGGSSNIEKKELIRKSKLTEGSTESRYRKVVTNSTILDSDTIEKLRERIKGIEFNDSYESYDDFLKANEGVDFNDAPFYKTAGGNSSVKGMFWNNTIYLFDKRSKELVVEHELVHSILKIASSKNDANYQRFQSEILGVVSEFLNNKTQPTEIDRFLNEILLFPDKTKIDELITRILTDKRFSDAFKSVKSTEVKKKETFWQKIVNAFKTLLGVEDGTYFDKILEPVVLYIDSLDYDTKSDPVYLSEETIEEELEDGYSKFNSTGKKIYKEFQTRVLKNDKKFFDNNYFERIDKFDSKGSITHDYEYNLANLEEGDLILAPVMVKSNEKWMYVTDSGELTEKVEDNKNYKTKWFPALYGNSPTYPTVAIGTEKGGSKIIKNKILGIRKLDKSGNEVNLLESAITIKKFREKAVAFRQAFLEGKSLPDIYKYSGYDRITLKTDDSYEVDDFEVGDVVTVKFKEGKSFYALVEKNQGSGLLVSSENKTFFVKPKDIAGVHKSKEGLLEDVEKVAGKLSDNKNYTVKSVTGSMTKEEYSTYRKKKNPDYVFKPEDFKTYKEKQTNIETLSKGDAVLVKWDKGFSWKSVLFSDGNKVVVLDGKYPKVYRADQIEKIAYNNKETSKSFTEQERILAETEGYKWNKDYYVVSAKRDKSELNRQFNLKRIHKLKPGDFITYNKSFMVGVKKVEYSASKMVHNITSNGLIEVPFEYKDKNGNTKYGIDRVKVDQIEKFIFNKENHTEIKDDIAKTYDQYKSRYFSKKVFKHKEQKSWELGNTKYFTVLATPELFLNQKYKDSDVNKYTIKDNVVYEVTPESEILATPVYEFGKDAPYIRMKKFGGKQYIVSGEERSFNIQYLKDKSGNLKPDSIEKILNLKRGEMINYQYFKDSQKYYYKTAVYNVGIKKEKVKDTWVEVPYVQAIVESGDNIFINDIKLEDIVSIGKIFVPPLTGSKPVAYSDLGDEFVNEELPNKDIILKKGLILESKTANIKFYTELINNIIENNPELKIEFENKEFFKDDQSYSIQDNTLFLNSDLISTSDRIGDLAPIWLYKASQEQPDVYSQLLETFETNPYIEYYKEKGNPFEYYISNKLSGRIENDFENKWAKENQDFFDLINDLSSEFTDNYLSKRPEENSNERSGLTPEQTQNIQELKNLESSYKFLGTDNQIQDFIDSIYKNSKVKKVVFHRTKSEETIDEFDKNRQTENPIKAFYFAPDNKYASYMFGKKSYAVVLDIPRLQVAVNYSNNDKDNYDGFEIRPDGINTTYIQEYAVYEPEQITILNSSKTIEKFKEFLDKNKQNPTFNTQRLDYTLLQEGKTKFKKIIENTLSTEVYKTKNPELINSGLIDQICNV